MKVNIVAIITPKIISQIPYHFARGKRIPRVTNEAVYIQPRAPSRILNRSAAQTQVKAGVKPELGRSVNINLGHSS